MIVAVGSTNPVKIKPVKQVFTKHFKPLKVIGVLVASGVKDQPMSDEETYQGALNRARAALSAVKGAQFGVGIEGGLHQTSYGWFEKALVVIVDQAGNIGVGGSAGIVLPDSIMQGIHLGKDLQQVMGELTGIKDIGKKQGMFGVMTDNLVTRTSSYYQAVAFAFGRFFRKDLY